MLSMPNGTNNGPKVIYVATDGDTCHEVDSEVWAIDHLTPRERGICIALLEHALKRIREAE